MSNQDTQVKLNDEAVLTRMEELTGGKFYDSHDHLAAKDVLAAYVQRAVLEARIDQIMIDALKYDLCLDVDESEILGIRDSLIEQLKDTQEKG